MVIKRSENLHTYDDEITLGQDSYYMFEASTAMISVKRVAGVDAGYTIIYWY